MLTPFEMPAGLLRQIGDVIVVAIAGWLAFLILRAIVYWLRPVQVDRTGNGIAAGPIKVYDNRFLSIRLDELERSLEKLASLHTQKLDDRVGTLQGKIVSHVVTLVTEPAAT